MKKLRLLLIACAIFMLPVFFCANAEAATLYKHMVVSSDEAAYYDVDGTYQEGTLSYGDQVTIVKKGSSFTKIKMNGTYYQVATSKLCYPYAVATGPSQKLYKKASTKHGNKGYVIRGTKMTVIGTRGSYLYVYVSKTYTSKYGKYTKKSKQYGYIKKSAVASYTTLQTVNSDQQLYASPTAENPVSTVLMGDTVKAYEYSSTNQDWAKVYVNGKAYFMSREALEPTVMRLNTNYRTMRTTTSSSSKAIANVYWNEPVVVNFTKTISGTTYAYCTTQDGDSGWLLAETSYSVKYLDYTISKVTTEDTPVYSSDEATEQLGTIPGDSLVFPIYEGDEWSLVYCHTSDGDSLNGYVKNDALQYEVITAYSGNMYPSAYKCANGKNPVDSFQGETEVYFLDYSAEYNMSLIMTKDGGGPYWVNNKAFDAIELPLDPNESEDSDVWYVAVNTQTVTLVSSGTKTTIPYRTPIKITAGTVQYATGGGTVKGEVTINGTTRTVTMYVDAGDLMHSLPTYNVLFTDYENSTMQKLANSTVATALDFAWYTPNVYCATGSSCSTCETSNTCSSGGHSRCTQNGHGDIDSSGNYHFMCSGFVAYCVNKAFEAEGIDQSISTSCQTLYDDYNDYAIWKRTSSKTAIDLDDLRPGDVLLFSNDGGSSCTHAALYLGNGDIAHTNPTYAYAKWRKSGVMISPFDGCSVTNSAQKLYKVLRFF